MENEENDADRKEETSDKAVEKVCWKTDATVTDMEKEARRVYEESFTLKVKAEFLGREDAVMAATIHGAKPEERVAAANDGGDEKKEEEEEEVAPDKSGGNNGAAVAPAASAAAAAAPVASAAGSGSSKLSSKERKERRGMNKKRPRDVKPADGDKMCIAVIRGETCPYGTECKYNHDLRVALEKRPPDSAELLKHMKGVCPIYASQGYCTYGIMCRLGSTHCNMSTGVNLVAATTKEEEEGVQPPKSVTNILSREVRDSLRKRQYDFKVAPPHQPNKGGGKRNNKRDRRARGGQDNANGDKENAKEQAPPSEKKEKRDEAPAEAKHNDTVPGESEAKTEGMQGDNDAKKDAATVQRNESCVSAEDSQMKDASCMDAATKPPPQPMDLSPLPAKERKLIDFRNKVYVAPLTTVGNLPFRRILKRYGADITCSEMALVPSLLEGKPSEWALLKRHASEDVFGIQIAAGFPDQFARISEVLEREDISCDFLDMNLGCPLDIVCDKGAGAALMLRDRKLKEAVTGMSQILSCPFTVKIRTGWEEQRPIAHNLVPKIQSWQISGLSAIFLHGRSRLQRYQKLANWDYIQQVANSQSDEIPKVPLIGNGDVFSFVDYEEKIARSGISPTAMVGRGALVKPWLPTEIKERRHWDISASERLDILKDFVRFGLEHWGTDQQGLNNTRRFLLEWLSFLYRYVPVGLLEVVPQQMNLRPPTNMMGRNDLETLMMSKHCDDWIKISEMLLGPVPDDFRFEPKHKANSYKS